MKGIAPIILIALVAVASILVTEGVYFNTYMGSKVAKEEAARELEVIRAVNRVESLKRGLPNALYYSFSETMRANSYSSVENITNSSEFISSMNPVFNDYRKASEGSIGVKIPTGKIYLNISGDEAVLDFSSTGFLAYESESVKVFDNPNATIKIKGSSLAE
jgi:hypothetical protein